MRGVLLCLVSSTCFGLSAIFAKEAYAVGVSVPTTLVGRFGVAALVLWAIVLVRRIALPSRRQVIVCVGLGLFYALQAALYFGALAVADASLVVLLVYIYPALTMVLAVLLRRESPDRRRVTALAVSGAGLVLLLNTGGSVGTAGVVLALAAAVCYALYLTAAEAQPTSLNLFGLTAIVCTTSTVTLAVWGTVGGSLAVPPVAGAVWILVLGVVSTVVPLVVLLLGVRAVGASTAAILSCFEPAVVVAVAAVLYGERLAPVQLLGGAAVIASVFILQAKRVPARPEVVPARSNP